MSTRLISTSGQKNAKFTNWDVNTQYRPGDMVVYSSTVYTTAVDIPAGTAWGPEWTIAVDSGGGGGTPGGANTQIQFNDDGAFGANSTFTFDKTTGLVSVKDLEITGNVTSTLLPDTNIVYDLGSPTQRWRDLYLSNNTIYMGDQTISANATHMNLTGTINATIFEGVLGNGTSNVSISAADGNIDFVVGGAQQWAMGTGGARR